MRKYYGIEFLSGINTTRGEPNPRTGRLSRAVLLEVFPSRIDRDDWVKTGNRISVLKSNIRNFYLGMSVNDFRDMLDYFNDKGDCNNVY